MAEPPAKTRGIGCLEPGVPERGSPRPIYDAPGPVVCSWLVEPSEEGISQSPTGNVQGQSTRRRWSLTDEEAAVTLPGPGRPRRPPRSSPCAGTAARGCGSAARKT